MPHLTLEYSANLDGKVDMRALCTRLRDTMLATGTFEIGAIRVRALCAQHYAITDLHPDNGFIDMSLRMGAGRSADERKAAGDAIIATAKAFLAPQLSTAHFALSLEVREIDPTLSWKLNSMHARLRDKP
jgi:5-carboxymethyl-2-hydroxymuconate isomerase